MAVLAGLLIQQVISKGVDIAGSALTAAAKDKATTLSGESASANYYVVDEKANLVADTSVGCVEPPRNSWRPFGLSQAATAAV